MENRCRPKQQGEKEVILMHGGQIIARGLKAQGVKFLFTLCGGHISPILVGAREAGIRVIDVRQEPTAVFAADAVSRLTGVPGVAVVTAGPGVTNSITAVKNAQMAQSPLVLFGGAPATVLRGKGALQDIEQIKLFETLVKWSASVKQDCDLPGIVEEAFDAAQSGVPGPVFIECPVDLLYDEYLVRQWYEREQGSCRDFADRVTRWYLRRHVDKLFACSPVSADFAQKSGIIPFSVDMNEIKAAYHQILEAKAPVLVLGSQAVLRTDKLDALSEKLDSLGIPMFLAGTARGLLGGDHPLQFRHKRSRALKEADVVIIAGMPCDFRLNYGRQINKDAFYIAVNRSKEALKLNKKPDLAVHADPSTFLLALAEACGSLSKDRISEWIGRLQTNEGEREDQLKGYMGEHTDYINPLYLCSRIDRALDKNSIIVCDGGDFVATASYLIRPRGPLCWLDPGPYGTLGVGAGFALAAGLVRPNAEIWLLYGDGAAGYSLIELDSFVRHKVPVIAVVGNDAGWTQITREQAEIFKDETATKLKYNNYEQIAEGLDAKGFLISEAAEIDAVLEQAKAAVRKGKPVLVNALLGKTDFRKGSISM
ncbi:MAG: thiamine pyrophosphate-binding protein [Desulfosalsimonas sp.]